MSLSRPRFSLRSLLLAVLTLAAGATVWKNFDPWRIEREYLGALQDAVNVIMSPDEKWILADLASSSDQRHTYKSILWNAETGRSEVLVDASWTRPPGTITGGSNSEFSKDSARLIAGLWRNNHLGFRLMDLRSISTLKLDVPMSQSIRGVRFLPDDRYMLFSLENDSIQIIDTQTNSVVIDRFAEDYRWSQSGDRIALIEVDGSIGTYDVKDGRQLQRIPPVTDWQYLWIAHVSHTRLIAGVVLTESYWDFDEKETVLYFDLNAPAASQVLSGRVTSVAWDDARIAIESDKGYTILDSQSLDVVTQIKSAPERALFVPIANNRLLCMGIGNPTAYDLSTGRMAYKLNSRRWGTLSPDRTRYIVPSDDAAPVLCIFDLSNGHLLQTIPNERAPNFGRSGYSSYSNPDSGNRFVTQNTDTHAIHLWRRHRPEPWWGLAWLPEFWITLVLTGGLLWSLRRDWRDRRAGKGMHAP